MTSISKQHSTDSSIPTQSLAALVRAVEVISTQLELTPTLAAIADEGLRFLGADRCAVYLLDSETGILRCFYSLNLSEEYQSTIAALYRKLPGGRLIDQPKPLFYDDAQSTPDYASVQKQIAREGFHGIALLPLCYRADPIGALVFYHDQVKEYSPVERELAMALANNVAIALGNAKLFDNLKSANIRLEELNAELSDIQQSLEEKVRARTQELEEANMLKSQFLSNASHELRTPLNSIIGFCEILMDPTIEKTGDDTKEFLTYIYQSGQKLLALIKNLLDISRLESGRLEFFPEEFSLEEFFEELRLGLLTQYRKETVEFHMELKCTVDTLFTDRGRLLQAIGNILSNAFKFSEEGGCVEVRVTNDENSLSITISDTGKGIPEQVQQRIFDDFYQVDSSISREHEGMGLGLALSRKFIEKMGGSIRVSSNPGEGSTFVVAIPLRGDR